jgi:P27 family predicted phage terminase small subunit
LDQDFLETPMTTLAADQRPKAPAHLRAATRRWFESVLDDFDLEQHDIRLLTLSAEAWDRGQQAREALAKEGLTFDDRFGQPHARPEVAIERDARIAFARLLRELALSVEGPSDEAPRAPRTADYGSRR